MTGLIAQDNLEPFMMVKAQKRPSASLRSEEDPLKALENHGHSGFSGI